MKITKKVYEEKKSEYWTSYLLQLGDFMIGGVVTDDPKRQWMHYRSLTMRALPEEICNGVSVRRPNPKWMMILERRAQREGREVCHDAGPEYERIYQILIDNACNVEYWKYLGKYGRQAVENYKKNWMTQILKPKDFDNWYRHVPKDVRIFKPRSIEDDE